MKRGEEKGSFRNQHTQPPPKNTAWWKYPCWCHLKLKKKRKIESRKITAWSRVGFQPDVRKHSPPWCVAGQSSRALGRVWMLELKSSTCGYKLRDTAESLLKYERAPNKWNLFIKNYVFVLICLNFIHLQSTLHLMQCTYWNILSTT